MRRLKLIYNPFSGDRTFKNRLDSYAEIFQDSGYEMTIFRSSRIGDIEAHIANMSSDWDAIAIAGGDGTVNTVINSMMHRGLNIPIGIIPAGTANDFAAFLNLPKDPERACAKIAKGVAIPADIGMANDRYFINVCGAGLFANVSTQVNPDAKSILGKLAYYLKGMEQLPTFEPIPVRITTSQTTYELDIFLFLALNTAGTGGFENLAPNASIYDGLLDFMAVRARPMMELPKFLFKLMRNELHDDPNILYFQDNKITVEFLEQRWGYELCDVDGEAGPKLPVTIKTIKDGIRLIL